MKFAVAANADARFPRRGPSTSLSLHRPSSSRPRAPTTASSVLDAAIVVGSFEPSPPPTVDVVDVDGTNLAIALSFGRMPRSRNAMEEGAMGVMARGGNPTRMDTSYGDDDASPKNSSTTRLRNSSYVIDGRRRTSNRRRRARPPPSPTPISPVTRMVNSSSSSPAAAALMAFDDTVILLFLFFLFFFACGGSDRQKSNYLGYFFSSSR